MVAIVTDVHYRMSLALIRDLAQAGVEVITCEQSRCRGSGTSPALGALSRYASRHVWLEGPEALRDLCREIGLARDCLPALLPVGAATLAIIAENRGDFDPLCGLCIPTAEQLDLLNSKPRLAALAAGLGVPLPESMAPGEDLDQFLDRQGLPCVVKPVCGEKLGLTAAARYAVAATREEAREAWERFSRLAGEPPVVQGYLPGRALGCSVLARSGEVLAAVCHRRIREYPAAGGPSTCCESFYDEAMIRRAYELLSSFRFVGMAMVEFKGAFVLEVNPRVWGSFPMTERADSPFAQRYARAAMGERLDYRPQDYKTGVRMRFTLNDGAAMLDYLRRGRPGPFFQGVADWFRAREALSAGDDPAPWRRYLRNTLLRR